MRLLPPVTSPRTTNNASPGAQASADSCAILPLPSHQHMQPTEQAHSYSTSARSPPFTINSNTNANTTSTNNSNNTSALYGVAAAAVAAQHQPPASSLSSLSPRLPGSTPAYSPPAYIFSQQNHDPSTLDFPDPPSTELAPLQLNAHADHAGNNSLPSLASLTGTSAPSSRRFASTSTTHDTNTPYSPSPSRIRSWPSGNPYSAYYAPGHGRADSPLRMDLDTASNGTRAPLSPDNMAVRASSVSLDDPDVRMAAEALGDLRAGEYYDPAVYAPFIPTCPVSPCMSPVHVTDMPLLLGRFRVVPSE